GKMAGPPMLHQGEVQAVSFLPGLPWVAALGSPGGLQVWDSMHGKPVTPCLTFPWAGGAHRYLVPVLGGRALAAFRHGQHVRLFDLAPLADEDPGRLTDQQRVRLAEVQSGFRIHEGSGVARLTTPEWLARWQGLTPPQRDPGAAGRDFRPALVERVG